MKKNITQKELMPKRHICPKPKGCGRDFPYTSEYFHTNQQQKWGLHVYCKECRNKHRRSAYKTAQIIEELKQTLREEGSNYGI